MWLNPPRHDDPHEDIIIGLHPAAAAAAADALAEAAEWASRDGDQETAPPAGARGRRHRGG